jgi:DNA-binding LacI/PurR family transcriptional regulator
VAPTGRPERPGPPTIEDVARAAGVGLGTASRALGGRPHVAADTRARVQAAARRLGYRPSAAARALSRGRTHTLEVVVPLATRYYYVEALRGIEDALAATDYALVIRTVERPADRDRVFDARDARARADGLLLVSVPPTPGLLARLAGAGVPAVLVDAEHAPLASVAVDHEAAAAGAVAHLLGLGHRRVGLIDHPREPWLAPGGDGGAAARARAGSRPAARRRGYRRALAAAGLRPAPELERVAAYSPAGGAAALAALLALPRGPTAVFVGSDTQTLGVLDGARRAGRRVPDDLAVVSYNDVELARYLGLTTVRVPIREMGRRGTELLLARLAAPGVPPVRERLPTRLVVRQTSGPLARARA